MRAIAWRRRPWSRPSWREAVTDDQALPLVILLVALATGLLWLCSVPFQRGPDEAAHFQVARFIRDHGRLPLFRPDELWLLTTPRGVVETYGAFPPLAYLLATLTMWPLAENAFWGARAVSLVAYLGTVVLTLQIGRFLFPATPFVGITAALGVAFLPQFTFTAAYFNNDTLAACESALLLYLLLRASRRGASPARMAGVGLCIGALLLTKYTAYAAAGVGFAAALGLVLRREEARSPATAALTGGVLVSAGWWFARNWVLYGELIPGQVIADAKALAGGNSLFVPAQHGINLLTLSTQTEFWEVTLQSFVGVFGFLTVFLDPRCYQGFALAAGLAATGLILGAWRHGVRRVDWGIAAIGGALVGGTVISAMVISTYGEFSAQGRYLFPALVPLAIAAARGWHEIGQLHRLLRPVPALLAFGMIALNGISLFGSVVPREFGPDSQRIVIHVDRPAAPQPVDRPIEVLGWSFLQGGLSWRPFDPALITEYRRPVPEVTLLAGGPSGTAVAVATARAGLPRRDVAQMYGGSSRLTAVGFQVLIPAATLPPGGYRIRACAKRRDQAPPLCESVLRQALAPIPTAEADESDHPLGHAGITLAYVGNDVRFTR